MPEEDVQVYAQQGGLSNEQMLIIGGGIAAAAAVSVGVAVLLLTPPPGPPPPPSGLSVQVSASPTSGTAPLTVSFTPSVSGGVPPYTYAWEFGDQEAGTSVNPTHTYQNEGTYMASVVVRDSQGNETQSQQVAITVTSAAPPPPPAALSVSAAAAPSSGNAPLTVDFSSVVSGGTPPYSYNWNFGDGSAPSQSPDPSHTYTESGTYTAKVAVVDSAGSSGTGQATVTAAAASQTPGSGAGLAVSVTQQPGSLPVWHISGLTPSGPFTVIETSGGGEVDYFSEGADSTGSSSTAFKVDALPAGSTVTLTVQDQTTGKSAEATFTLQSYSATTSTSGTTTTSAQLRAG